MTLLLLPLPGARGICNSPPRLSFAELPGVVNNSYPVGTKLKYSCRPGYILNSGKSPFVTCLPNSAWSVDPEFCVGRPCKPVELQNGRVDLTDLRFGAIAKFSCDEGYRLIGPTSAQCVVVGNGVDWDKELPLCQAILCLPPPDISHGSHNGQSGQEFYFGSAVTYKCDQGFSLIGEASVHCTTKDHVNGEWSGPAPECKEKQSTSDVCEMVPESRVFTECGVPLEKLKTLLEVRKLYLEIEKLKQELKSQ
ncbi:hypothetical protein G0U57_015043 [Chelydra serpentina]|uniref:Sushi domain-containing protein n=1 Tax=Chelydra serpentina TaxID=8475 RepID=A0A8T1T385_CHESE|nr:hypothetical protein G0U57_015043 [Chelydra serpentina]